MPIFIRQAVPDDAAAVLAMMHLLLDEPHLSISRETFDFTVEQEREFLERIVHGPSDAYFVAVQGVGKSERFIGNIWMRGNTAPSRCHCASIGIAVVPEHRGRGIGARLMKSGLAWARERGLARVELTVHHENEGARRLYERFGFAVEGRHRALFQKGGLFMDALSMALMLEPVQEALPGASAST